MSEPSPLRVLYIAGMGRSGSTLLARVLGQIDGFVNIGEATRCLFHSRMYERLNRCECGSDIAECPFWKPLLPDITDHQREVATKLIRVRSMPRLDPSRLQSRLRSSAPELGRVMEKFLSSIRTASGAHTIVDASKNPAFGAFLASVPGVELHTIHVVRDPRAVIASWSKPKGYLRRHPPLKVAAWWVLHNVVSERLTTVSSSYRRLRYETFFANVESSVRRLVDHPGAPTVDLGGIIDGQRVFLEAQHTVAGNPDRTRSGWIDVEVRPAPSSVPWQRLVDLVVGPLNRRYSRDD